MTSNKLQENDNQKQQICPRCGKTFWCGAGTGNCWCAKYSLSENALQKLNESFNGCLCEACLKAFTEKQPEKLS
jgi:hypothetical protein